MHRAASMAAFPLWHQARLLNNERLTEEMAAYPCPLTPKGTGWVFIAGSGGLLGGKAGIFEHCEPIHFLTLRWSNS